MVRDPGRRLTARRAASPGRSGAWLAPGVDPASVGATAADSIVVAPPTTGTILVVLAQPALAAAVYTFLVAWNGRPDLDRWIRVLMSTTVRLSTMVRL